MVHAEEVFRHHVAKGEELEIRLGIDQHTFKGWAFDQPFEIRPEVPSD